jgi:transposase InsO family protein
MPPIPPAGDIRQAALESDFLEVIGKCPKDRWRPRIRPFGIKSVTPRPDALIVRIAREYLPDIIRDIAPAWPAEEERTATSSACTASRDCGRGISGAGPC